MAKRKIRAYARHKKCGHIMEPFDFDVNQDVGLRLEADGTAILTEAGRVPRLVTAAKDKAKIISRMVNQAVRLTRCLHCKEDVSLTTKDALVIDMFVKRSRR
jgi:hypothetical protein